MITEQEERAEILARLRASREELRQLLEPAPGVAPTAEAPSFVSANFPRSRTMRALMSSKGLTALGAAATGLVIARPALAFRLIKLLPASAFARILMGRLISSFRGRP